MLEGTWCYAVNWNIHRLGISHSYLIIDAIQDERYIDTVLLFSGANISRMNVLCVQVP
jgi:hypothetical protein